MKCSQNFPKIGSSIRRKCQKEARISPIFALLRIYAKWEYACRAGTKSAFNNGGDSEDDMKKLGRFVLNQKERGWKERYADFARHVPDGKGGNPGHHTVAGSYEPNAWGLYDMHGNVWESCRDWRGELVYGNDPGGSSSGSCRVLRGGSWDNAASVTTSSRRGGCKPSLKSVTYGFRLCCIAAGAMDAAGQK